MNYFRVTAFCICLVLMRGSIQAVTYTSEVESWPKLTVRVLDSCRSYSDSKEVPTTLVTALVDEDSLTLGYAAGQDLMFTIPGGVDYADESGEVMMAVAGIPEMIPDKVYRISVPPGGFPDVYFGPIEHVAGEDINGCDVNNIIEETSNSTYPESCPYSRETGSGHNLKWDYQHDTVTFKMNMTTSQRTEINAARDIWNQVSSLYLNYGGTTSATYARDNVNTVGKKNWGQNGTLACAYYWYTTSNGHFVEADIMINYSYAWNHTCASASFDLRSVVLHEFGHVLGLDHVNNSNHVMSPTLSSGECRRTLGCGDSKGVKAIYGDYIWNWQTTSLGVQRHHLASVSFIDSVWKLNPGVSNPYFIMPAKNITDPSHFRYIKISARKTTPGSTTARIYYRYSGQSGFSSSQYKEFSWGTSSGILQKVFDMYNAPGWRTHTIYQIRIDPMDTGTSGNDYLYLDWMKILNSY